MNSDLRKKKQKMILKKIFLSWRIILFLEKLCKMIEKNIDIKVVATEKRRNYLVSEPNYHTAKVFTERLLAIELNKKEILMNKPVHLGLSVLEWSKILMYEFSYD